MTSLLEEIASGTLAWCNEMRALKGDAPLDRLPRGERRDGTSCPCGKATGLFVDTVTYAPSPISDDYALLPVVVQQFVELFDEGHLPEYDSYASGVTA